MTKSIGYFNSEWNSNRKFLIPLMERGITFGNGIFETILILQGQPQLLKEHINRWHNGAKILRLNIPPTESYVQNLINEAIKKTSLFNKNGYIRLNWSRKDLTPSGINILSENKDNSNYYFWLEVNHSEPYFEAISVMISKNEKRNADSLISKCKSFGYMQSIQARQEAKFKGYDDALMLSTNGKICCGTTSNIIIKRQGEYLTPHLNTGCLPGIMRGQGLKAGIIKEAEIEAIPETNDEWLLINSLSCQPIKQLDNQPLKIITNAKNFWSELLKAS